MEAAFTVLNRHIQRVHGDRVFKCEEGHKEVKGKAPVKKTEAKPKSKETSTEKTPVKAVKAKKEGAEKVKKEAKKVVKKTTSSKTKSS